MELLEDAHPLLLRNARACIHHSDREVSLDSFGGDAHLIRRHVTAGGRHHSTRFVSTISMFRASFRHDVLLGGLFCSAKTVRYGNACVEISCSRSRYDE